jgi:hypothetical protein
MAEPHTAAAAMAHAAVGPCSALAAPTVAACCSQQLALHMHDQSGPETVGARVAAQEFAQQRFQGR